MDIGLVIVAIIVAALVLYLMTKMQDPPEHAMTSRPRVKREVVPEQDRVSQSDQMDRDIEALRESIQSGLKTIFPGVPTEQADGPLPSTRYDITLDVYHAVKENFVDVKEFSSAYKISNMLDDPNVDLSMIAKIISTDPILSSKILRTVNSAFYGSGRNVDSVNHALALLGFVNIKTILFQNVFSKKLGAASSEDSLAKAVWDHSIKTALCAVYLSDAIEGLNKGRLYTLGLLHDIGKFVCPKLASKSACDANALLPYGEKASIIKEDELLGTNHAVVSRIALEESGISDQLLDVIEFHHGPSFTLKSIRFTKEPDHRYLAALFLANQIAKLFAKESDSGYFAVQPMAHTYYGFVNQSKLSTIFSDGQVIADIVRSGSLIE